MSHTDPLQESLKRERNPVDNQHYLIAAEGALKFPHGWFWPITVVSFFSAMGVMALANPSLSEQERGAVIVAVLFWHLIEVVLLCTFTYQLWKKLQDGQTEITPGKAVGYLFIPFFGVYWLFRVWAGYATAFNTFCKRHGLSVRASRGITLTFTLTWPLAWIMAQTPIGPVLVLAGWITEMVFVAHTGKLTSNLTGLSVPAAGVKRCPQCAEWVKAEALLCRYCHHTFATEEVEQQPAEASLPGAALAKMGEPVWAGNTRER